MQSTEALRALAQHEDFGIASGVWHLLSVNAAITDPSCWQLAKRYGLSQDDLAKLLEDGGIKIATSKPKGWTDAILAATGVTVHVFKAKTGPHTIDGVTGLRF